MRILRLNDHYSEVGGAEKVLLLQCLELERCGYETAVAYAVDEPGAPVDAPRRSWHIPGLDRPRRNQIGDCLDCLQRCIEEFRPDLVHADNIENATALTWLAERLPVVRTVHAPALWCPGNGKVLWRDERICDLPVGPKCFFNAYYQHCAARHPAVLLRRYAECKEGLRAAQRIRIVVASRWMKQQLLANGVAAANVTCIPLYVEFDEATPVAAGGTGKILFVGRFVPHKGAQHLLRAAALLRTQAPQLDWHLELVGEGGDIERLRQLAASCGIADRCRFAGKVPMNDMSACYRDAGIVVVPSVWPEPWGLVGLEAMHHGLPVVAFAVGGIPEWLDGGVTGLLVPPGDVPGMARAIADLLTDPARARALGAAGRERALREFSRERHMGSLLNLYAEMLSGSPAP